MAKRAEDRFANLASAVVTLSAADTLTFTELQTGIGLGQGVGILIDMIDYEVSPAMLELMTASGDQVACGWSTSDAVTDVNVNERRVIDYTRISRHDHGTAASGEFVLQPQRKTFIPSLVIAAPRLYLFGFSVGLASVGTIRSRIFFRYIDLTDKEYLELAETFILVG